MYLLDPEGMLKLLELVKQTLVFYLLQYIRFNEKGIRNTTKSIDRYFVSDHCAPLLVCYSRVINFSWLQTLALRSAKRNLLSSYIQDYDNHKTEKSKSVSYCNTFSGG